MEVTAFIGRGGMGEVYRARDTKLKRDVAIKVLPDNFSRDADRLNRFTREAEVLASLNHPNIAAIYDLYEAAGSRYLVLELVEGETLAERIARGPIPVERALEIAKHICEALETAHEKGIVHRDLKPANVKLTPDGKVKVLDFGLAKAAESSSLAITLSHAPTSLGGTTGGMVMGTAGYMSPEQATGRTVDRRADIFAFGCVLYEMLTGRPAFDGEGVTEILHHVATADPDWTCLPTTTPWLVQRLLRRALTKDPKHRLADIRDARMEIEDANTLIPIAVDATTSRRPTVVWVLLAIILVLGTALVIVSAFYFRQPLPAEIRVEISVPATSDLTSFALSPDGRRFVFSAAIDGKSSLWLRGLDALAAQPLVGTDGATYPFWSPDGASLGFFADGKLKRIDIAGGAPQILANAPNGRGGTWNRDGIILFAPSATATGPLLKVPATGGEPVAVTKFETGASSHRFPQFLPDGRHFIYFVFGGPAHGVYISSLDAGSSERRLAMSDAAAVVSPSGFLLFARQSTLFAQAFDFRRLELSGNPFALTPQVVFDPGTTAPGFSAASNIVAYRSGSAAGGRQLTWLDRSGKNKGTMGAPDSAGLTDVELSPDGKRVAVYRTVSGNTDVWLIDAIRGVPTRFTFDPAVDWRPVWSPDGTRVMFNSNRKGAFNLYWRSLNGAGADELKWETDQNKMPTGWSSDGRFLLFRALDPQTGFDLWVLPISANQKAFPFLKTPFDEREAQFSPDGKWLAYQSNESGRYEIYIQPFSGPQRKLQISDNGGAQPRWNKNGREIFYISLDSHMMTATVKPSREGESLEAETPVALFPVRVVGGPVPGINKQQYDVSADGERFLVNLPADESSASPITLIYNWRGQPAK